MYSFVSDEITFPFLVHQNGGSTVLPIASIYRSTRYKMPDELHHDTVAR